MPAAETMYNASFYKSQMVGSYRSAGIVLPRLFEHFKPRSVVDFGCGVGTWLRACLDLGVEEILGLDGSHVKRELLEIPADSFRACDLRSENLQLPRRFDLAMSLEVAEHLPGDRADNFISGLCSAADVVLFAAAIPGQRGTMHINEQFPSYWIPKFEAHGFQCFDFLRKLEWCNSKVDIWYRQNVLVFSRFTRFPEQSSYAGQCDIVHPEMWIEHRNTGKGLGRVIRVARDELVYGRPAWMKRLRRRGC
jgi:SAM-dependent methyltransferase